MYYLTDAKTVIDMGKEEVELNIGRGKDKDYWRKKLLPYRPLSASRASGPCLVDANWQHQSKATPQ